jgi:prepilin-type N-terminal cleavage/methylation domain-containing protein/prepilin-type processing-associated H-X9-DG protein
MMRIAPRSQAPRIHTARPVSPRAGFTLVELLVVIAIIGVLVALLLPAVQAAREAARRSQCQNNLRQIGLALQNYHDAQKVFPASTQFPDGRYGMNRPEGGVDHLPNYMVSILPYMEQQTLYDAFDKSVFISDPINRELRGTEIPTLLCPSDPKNRDSKFAGRNSREGDNWARGNYGANASLGFMSRTNREAGGPDTRYWLDPQTRGVMGLNAALTIGQILDGTSQTLMVGELRAGLSENDRRGTWALGGPGASSLWGHATDNAIGPNACMEGSDSISGCAKIQSDVGKDTTLAECMACDDLGNSQGGVRSAHPGGAYCGFVDGSVHFISDFIDKGTLWELDPKEYHTWQRLCASGDEQVMDQSEIF